MQFVHKSVLLNQCIDGLNINPNGIYVDGTAGGAGHSAEIARHLEKGKLFALDKDPDAIAIATTRLAPYPQAQVIQADYAQLTALLQDQSIAGVDGILLDLGVSSHQLDTPERGFSYNSDAPLDMRMAQSGLSAYDIVNTFSVAELIDIIKTYGEERFASRIARNIEAKRKVAPIQTTLQLVDIIKQAIPAAARNEGGHPAKRTFQALRIAVNSELDHLKICLDTGFAALNPGGRFVIITFHSLEDRIVKQNFVAHCTGCTCPPDFPICICGKTPAAKLINRKPIEATPEEQAANKRSRSAKLRILEKL